MTRTTTVSMLDRVEEIRETEIAPREAVLDELREEASEYDAWDIPDEIEQKYDRLQSEVKSLEGEARTLEEYAEEWGEDQWVIRELSVGTVAAVQDDVVEASGVNMEGDGTPRTGYARKRTIEAAVKDSPNDAPKVEDLPDAIGDWLFACIDEFNTTGEVSLGNSSLRMEMIDSAN